MLLEPGDVFLTHGRGFVSRSIRFLTRKFGEPSTKANHVGIIATAGNQLSAWGIEALARVRYHQLSDQYDINTDVCVFRPINLSEKEKKLVVAKAVSYVDRPYGYLKLALHLADWCLLGAYVFRRLARMDRYPICSYLVASSFKVVNADFGVTNYAASPDDIWDFCISNPDKYKFVWQQGDMYANKIL